MSGSMPYQLEKGPYFAVTEAVLDDIERRIWILGWLRGHREEGFDNMPSLDSTTLNANGAPNQQARYQHQNVDWYGLTHKGGGPNGRDSQPQYNPPDKVNTGYWRNWYGNAEGIVREAFIRAIEVSLGAPHKPDQVKLEDIRAEKRREWPIEVFWRCPAPWFEAWVTWRGRPHGVVGGVSHSGHVTLHIHTPGHKGSALLTSPLRVPPHNTIDEYREEPANGGPPYLSSEGDRGMWVIAQKNQSLRNKDGSPLTVLTSLDGDWDVPHMPLGAHYVSEGEVVVVQPNEPDGGVRAGGRPYFEGI